MYNKKKRLLLFPALLVSSQLFAGPVFWGSANSNFQTGSDVFLAKHLNAPPPGLTKLFPLSVHNLFSIDIDQDGAPDFIIESRTKKQTCFVKSDLSIKRCEAFNDSLNDGFAYKFFVSNGRGRMLLLLDLSGFEDDSNYTLKTFDPKTWKLKTITEIYPLVESNTRSRKGIYFGYPWDIDSLPTKAVNGETTLRVTFDHQIDEEPMMGDPRDTTKGPAILFKGKATQGEARGEYDNLRQSLEFLPISRIVRLATGEPALTTPGIKIFPKYESRGGPWNVSMQTMHPAGPSDNIKADLAVGSPGCSGSFSGTGTIDGHVARLRPDVAEGDAGCEIRLEFLDGGAKIRMEEDGCSHWHGRSCEFSGTLTKHR